MRRRPQRERYWRSFASMLPTRLRLYGRRRARRMRLLRRRQGAPKSRSAPLLRRPTLQNERRRTSRASLFTVWRVRFGGICVSSVNFATGPFVRPLTNSEYCTIAISRCERWHFLKLARRARLLFQRCEEAVGPVLDVVVREHLNQRIVPIAPLGQRHR